MTWITENMGSIIFGVLALAIFLLALIPKIKEKRTGDVRWTLF